MDTGREAYEKALQDEHGKLLSCSCYYHSNGMMMNSNAISDLELKIADDGSVLTVTSKEAFQKRIIKTYRIKDEDLSELNDFVSENRLWAYSELKYIQDPRFVMYDYSVSRSASLVFDESQSGKTYATYHSLNYDAMRQNGFEKLFDNLVSIMRSLEIKGELLYRREEGISSFSNVEVPKQDNGSEDGEICPTCGYRPVSGKFCPECGTRVKQ